MCVSEGDSEAWIERGLYAALLDMAAFSDVLESARQHVVMGSVHSNSSRMFFFLEIDRSAALFHFFSLRWSDWD
jgi:hypothetical protein